jgi:hypothetical protein
VQVLPTGRIDGVPGGAKGARPDRPGAGDTGPGAVVLGGNRVPYRGTPYWERESPEEARAGNVLLRWYPQAGKLQCHRLFRTQEGQERTAAVVTLDIEALALAPEARRVLETVLRQAEATAGSAADEDAAEVPEGEVRTDGVPRRGARKSSG